MFDDKSIPINYNLSTKTSRFLNKIKVASATVVVTLRLHINTNKIDHVLVLNVYIFHDEGYSWINPICEILFSLATTIIQS